MPHMKMKIPTSHGNWLVVMVIWANFPTEVLYFSICKKKWLNRVESNAVPKTVRKKARCFLVDPKRFGYRSIY